MLTAKAYDIHVEQIFERAHQLHAALTAAGVPYRIVGGLAVFLHVAERDPLSARMTPDIDAAIEREQLPTVIEAARKAGWVYRHAAGGNLLIDAVQPTRRSPIRLLEGVGSGLACTTSGGLLIAPVGDLVRMKLTSYRLKDRVHIQDLDGVGLITPEIEAGLPDLLRQRLAEIRATE
jgi:hypothetical protein